MLACSDMCFQALNLGGCRLITNASVQSVAQHLNQLEHLVLSGCPHVTDFDVQDVTEGCPLLLTLALRACPRLTDDALKSIGKLARQQQNAGLSGLSNIDIGGCSHIQRLKPLASACCLQKLDMRGLPKVAQRSVVMLVADLPELRFINVTGSTTAPGALADELRSHDELDVHCILFD